MTKENPKERETTGPGKKARQSQAPKWQKSPQQLIDLFARLQAGLPPDAERRKMFGYPCSFVHGQMFAGLHQTNMVLRLGQEERLEFLKLPGAKIFEPMPGRTMKEYVVVPNSLKGEEEILFKWTLKAFSYAKSLGPKERKKISR